MEISKPYCCKELKNKAIMDSTGKTIGHISDLTFEFDKELNLVHFILSGSKWTEFLETIRLKPDHNHVFDSSAIKKIDQHIHLDITGEQLLTNSSKNAISDNEVKFSELEKLDVFDKDQEKIGRAIDVDLDVDGSISLVIGGGFVEEKLEAIGLKDDVDIIVPSKVISSIGDSVQLTVSKDELDTTLDGILKEKAMKIQQERAAAKDHRRARRERVVAFWPYVSK